MSQIMVLGSFVMDNVAIVDRFCTDGETVIAKEFSCFPGGKEIYNGCQIRRRRTDVRHVWTGRKREYFSENIK